MKYKTIQLSHTEEIMQKYGVNSLMAKVIESKKLDQKQFEAFMDPHLIYHDFSLFEESDETLERIEAEHGFTITKEDLLFGGVCAECKEKSKNKTA